MLWETPLMGCGVKVMTTRLRSVHRNCFAARENPTSCESLILFQAPNPRNYYRRHSVQNLSNAPPSK